MKSIVSHTACFIGICFSQYPLSGLAASNTISIYGPEQGIAIHKNINHPSYNLYLGSFRIKSNAANYKALLSCKVNKPITFYIGNNKKAPYQLVIKSIDLKTLHQISHQLLNNTSCHHLAKKKANQQSGAKAVFVNQNSTKPKRLVELSTHIGFSQPNSAQTLELQPSVNTGYTSTNDIQTQGGAELFWGQKVLTQKTSFKSYLGLTLATDSPVNVSGDALVDANPNFNNFTYSYKVKHSHIGLKGKILPDVSHISFLSQYQPYLNATIAAGFNRAYQYSMTPKINTAVIPPPFHSHTEAALTYALGLGVEKRLSHQWSLGLGYELTDWGKSKLSPASGQTLGDGLSLNHLYVNQVQLSLNYQNQNG